MDPATQLALAKAGAFCAMGISAIGSAYGCGVAGASAIGSWKKCYAQGKQAPFQLSVLTGAPMTQTIYGLILMTIIKGKVDADFANWPLYLFVGIVGGIAIAISGAFQGRAAAGACDAFAETGKGFTNYLLALGIVETIAIFAMVFAIMLIG